MTAQNKQRVTFWVSFSIIVASVPVLTGWVGNVYEVSKAPARIEQLQNQLQETRETITKMKYDLQYIRESNARIERALRIVPNNPSPTQP